MTKPRGDHSHKDKKTREELIAASYKLYNDDGYTLREVGKELNISHEQVRRYILIAEDRFTETSRDLVARYKKKHIKDLNRIQKLAELEFERSREDLEKTTVKTSTGGQFGLTTDETITTQGRIGDASLLRVANDAIDKKNKTLGIYQEEEEVNEASEALKAITQALGQTINKNINES